MLFAELAKLADGHAGIAKYLDENRDILGDFLEGFRSPSEVEDFIQLYLGGHSYEKGERIYLGEYLFLYEKTMEHKKYLSFITPSFCDKDKPMDILYSVDNNHSMKNPIRTEGNKKSGLVGMV